MLNFTVVIKESGLFGLIGVDVSISTDSIHDARGLQHDALIEQPLRPHHSNQEKASELRRQVYHLCSLLMLDDQARW